ncbi:MAG TPA: NAD-dependent epimerase/dehydratase family protein [Solirubrobacterales bacterium]
MARALITGGCGFIGSHLGSRLEDAGYEVDLVDNLARGVVDADLRTLLERPSVRLIECDLLDPEALAGLDDGYELIFHLAAIVGVANVLERPYEVLDLNVAMTARALELAARQERLERFVFASTSEVYAGTLEQFELEIPTPENAPIALPDLARPRTSYMLSKLYGEALCIHSGVPVTVIRPHNVYGPRMGMSHVIPELLERARKAADGDRLEVYSVDHKRTFCYVEDAVEMIFLAARSPETVGKALNVGKEGPEVAIGELAEMVIETVGRDLAVDPQPATQGSPSRRAPKMLQMKAFTGYAAQVEVAEGLRRTYRWYEENVFGGLGSGAR